MGIRCKEADALVERVIGGALTAGATNPLLTNYMYWAIVRGITCLLEASEGLLVMSVSTITNINTTRGKCYVHLCLCRATMYWPEFAHGRVAMRSTDASRNMYKLS